MAKPLNLRLFVHLFGRSPHLCHGLFPGIYLELGKAFASFELNFAAAILSLVSLSLIVSITLGGTGTTTVKWPRAVLCVALCNTSISLKMTRNPI